MLPKGDPFMANSKQSFIAGPAWTKNVRSCLEQALGLLPTLGAVTVTVQPSTRTA